MDASDVTCWILFVILLIVFWQADNRLKFWSDRASDLEDALAMKRELLGESEFDYIHKSEVPIHGGETITFQITTPRQMPTATQIKVSYYQ